MTFEQPKEEIMSKNTLMIFGLGDLGGYVLEFLAREPNVPRIVAADKNEDWGIRKTNSALIGAAQFNCFPDIEFYPLDIFDIDATTRLLERERPRLIYNSLSLQSWWVITQLPPAAYKTIDEARFAPWFPMHYVPAHKLMQAVQKSGIETVVVNAAFPDLVNPALAKLGLAPNVGIGNIDNIVGTLRLVAARMLKAPLRSVNLYMVCPHYVSYYMARYGTAGDAPYYLKVMVDDEDVTSRMDMKDLLAKCTTAGKRPGSIHAHPVVASSVFKILRGVFADTKELGHAPGPEGLPGGYPIRLTERGAELFLPEGVTREQAIKINEDAQVYEGVESINDDGSVVLTDQSAGIFKELLDFDCKVYLPDQCAAKAKELDEKFRKWAGLQK